MHHSNITLTARKNNSRSSFTRNKDPVQITRRMCLQPLLVSKSHVELVVFVYTDSRYRTARAELES